MTWQIFEAQSRVDERVVAKARAEGRKWNMDDMKHLGPEWSGGDRRLNPLHATRLQAFAIAACGIGIFALALYGWRNGGIVPKGSVEMLAYIALLPGSLALFYGFAVPKFNERNWFLELDGREFRYRRSPTIWEPFSDGTTGSWSVPLASVARVETGATADWEPTRRALLREKPVPREEMQTFLFMADGSRRVIATVHGGRESMLALAQSIRSSLQAVREYTDRAAGGHAARSGSGEGFNI